MKFKKLAVASAMAVAALSGQAMAAAPGINPITGDFFTPDIDVYLTGASAPQNILGALAETLFGANTAGTFNNYHVFYDNGSTIGAFYRAYYGTLQIPLVTGPDSTVGSGYTLPIGTKVRLINRNKGGSVWGVDPVARTQNIAWMNPSSSNCTTTTSSTYQYLCAESGSDTDPLNVDNRISDFGVSDVEPPMFKETLNVEGSAHELSVTELVNLTPTSVSGLLFGLPATTSVPLTINFTRGLYSALLSGVIQDWTTVDANLTGKTQVVVCRRVQGSGTQTTYNAYFNNFPCAAGSKVPGVLAPLRMADSADYAEDSIPFIGTGGSNGTLGVSYAGTITVNPDTSLTTTTVVENSTSGNVRTCLEKAQTGGTHTVDYLTDFGENKLVKVNFATGGGYRAIGTLSFDSTPVVGRWDFRTLNGITGTKTTLRNGNYDFFGELSLQYNNTGHNDYYPIAGRNNKTNWVSTPPTAGSAPYVRNKRAFIEEFIRRAGDPTTLDKITNAQLRNATAALPLVYVPSETGAATGTGLATGLNTMYVTHQGNACSPVVRYPYPGL